MSTFKNCYALTASVRRALGSFSEAKVRGEDTLGAFDNDYILEKINTAIRELYGLISRRTPEIFKEEAALTGVNSVFTLPWDFGKLEFFKDENGLQVQEIGEAARRLTDSQGSRHLYQRVGNTLVLDQAGISLTYTLIYRKKPRDIHHGLAQAGGTKSLTMMTARAPRIADYFNGMLIENVTSDWVDTISDYAATRVATLAAENAVKNDAYGLVPEIPDWSHHLIAPRATLTIRQEHPLIKRKPTAQDIADYTSQVRTTLAEYAAPSEDIDYQELFTNYAAKAASSTVIW